MVQVIPAILEKNLKEVQAKLNRLEGICNWAQIDIADGKFVNNKTWNNPEELEQIKTNLNLEIHLMVEEPEIAIDSWLKPNQVKRLIVHKEAALDIAGIIEKAKDANKQIGIALNPETGIEAVCDHLVVLDTVTFLGVTPGFSGQEFDETVLEKIKKLRKIDEIIDIAVDGGVNKQTARRIIQAGANILNAASSLWKSKDIKKAIEELELP